MFEFRVLKWIAFVLIVCMHGTPGVVLKHSIDPGRRHGAFPEVCNRLRNAGPNSKFSAISCIGAKYRNQRHSVHKAFGLDRTLSSTLCGPLKPRLDLWEIDGKGVKQLILDTELPTQLPGELDALVDSTALVNFCSLSAAVIIYLNPEDFIHDENGFKASGLLHKFLTLLDTRLSTRQKPIYIVLPKNDAKNDLSKVVKALFKRQENVQILECGDKLASALTQHFSKVQQPTSTESQVHPAELAKAISGFKDPNEILKNTLSKFLEDANLKAHNKVLQQFFVDVLEGPQKREAWYKVAASLKNASLALYLASLNLQNPSLQDFYVDKMRAYSNEIAYEGLIRLITLLQKDSLALLRQRLAMQSTDAEPDDIAKEVLDEHDRVVKSVAPPVTSDAQLAKIARAARQQLESQLNTILKLYATTPSSPGDAMPLNQSDKNINHMANDIESSWWSSLISRVSVGLGLTAVLRQPGQGNRQGWFIYSFGPLSLALGYANDGDIAEAKPGTGIQVPQFKMQPKLHFNISL